jgi:hypothetical protein
LSTCRRGWAFHGFATRGSRSLLGTRARAATAAPLFLVYAARIAHYPIQAPAAYQELPHIAAIETPHRMVYHAQV